MKRKCGKNTTEVTGEKSHFLQHVAEYVSKKHGRGQLIMNFLTKCHTPAILELCFL